MPDEPGKSSISDRRRDLARVGLDLTEERVAELMARFDDVDSTIAAIRAINVNEFEPDAVFAPRPADE